MKIFNSLKNTLTLNFIIAAALPILVVGLITLQSVSVSMKKDIAVKNFLIAKALASELERFLNEPLRLLRQVKQVRDKKDFISQDKLNEYLALLIEEHRFFTIIKILDREGRVTHLAPFDENIKGMNMSYQDYYPIVQESGKAYWSKTFVDPQNNQPTLTLALPCEKGMVIGNLNLSYLNDMIQQIKFGVKGYASVTDSAGILIAHPNETFVLERLNVSNVFSVKQGMAGNEGTFPYQFLGEDKIGSVAIVPQTRWLTFVGQPADEAYAPIKRVRNILLSGSLAAIILAIVIAVISLRKALKPLVQLSKDSQRIAKGDYSYTPGVTAYLETNHLRDSFEVMVKAIKARNEALQQAHDSLELKVAERTSELYTSKKAAEAAQRAAESANKAKSNFLANMSHEIRTPMNAVLGFAEVLQDIEKEPEKIHYLEIIQNSGKELLRLINDILDLSKIEAGKIELQYSPVSIKNLLWEIEMMFKPKAMESGLELSTQIITPHEYKLLLDEARIRQIVINLISNAIKFTEHGSISITADLCNKNDGFPNQVDLTIRIEDTGIGIAPDQLDKIFGPFDQASGQNANQYEGTGLGLAISRGITEIMDGRLSVKSKPGKGSVFTLHLPDVEMTTTEDASARSSNPYNFESITFKPAKVLIVDDIGYNRELLISYLSPWEFKILEAENGKEALKLTQQHQPDIILMDIKMPVMNGYEATTILKQTPGSKDIPIIAITASALKKDEEKISELCDGYIRKPVDKNHLIEELLRVLPHTKTEPQAQPQNAESGLKHTNPPESTITFKELTKKSFEFLSKAHREQLAYAVSIGDFELCHQIIGQLGQNDDDFTAALTDMVNKIRFTELAELLK
jgi:signal transduction histidine kinase/DNA-binding response OmpR family regulator